MLRSGRTGRDEFDAIYTANLEREAEWLRRGAKQKVDSIQRLLERNAVAPNSILELGCGTGAVIAEIRKRGIGTAWYGVDSSESAISYLRARVDGVQAVVADVTVNPDPFAEGRYDVVVLSHVLEHLETPAEFLRTVVDSVSFGYLIAEVPLENLLAGRLKALFRDRAGNDAGHVQFFNSQDFVSLLEASGLVPADDYRYAPWFDLDTIRRQQPAKPFARSYKLITQNLAPRYLAFPFRRFYHAHLAVLCTGGKADT
jgi:SAM-dependent methyltransferase